MSWSMCSRKLATMPSDLAVNFDKNFTEKNALFFLKAPFFGELKNNSLNLFVLYTLDKCFL